MFDGCTLLDRADLRRWIDWARFDCLPSQSSPHRRVWQHFLPECSHLGARLRIRTRRSSSLRLASCTFTKADSSSLVRNRSSRSNARPIKNAQVIKLAFGFQELLPPHWRLYRKLSGISNQGKLCLLSVPKKDNIINPNQLMFCNGVSDVHAMRVSGTWLGCGLDINVEVASVQVICRNPIASSANFLGE